jgi:hypothetical protein
MNLSLKLEFLFLQIEFRIEVNKKLLRVTNDEICTIIRGVSRAAEPPPPRKTSDSGLPNPNFRNQEFFVKNQELIRRLFLENQEVFSMKWRLKYSPSCEVEE